MPNTSPAPRFRRRQQVALTRDIAPGFGEGTVCTICTVRAARGAQPPRYELEAGHARTCWVDEADLDSAYLQAELFPLDGAAPDEQGRTP